MLNTTASATAAATPLPGLLPPPGSNRAGDGDFARQLDAAQARPDGEATRHATDAGCDVRHGIDEPDARP